MEEKIEWLLVGRRLMARAAAVMNAQRLLQSHRQSPDRSRMASALRDIGGPEQDLDSVMTHVLNLRERRLACPEALA